MAAKRASCAASDASQSFPGNNGEKWKLRRGESPEKREYSGKFTEKMCTGQVLTRPLGS
jgi:hypothetical protein